MNPMKTIGSITKNIPNEHVKTTQPHQLVGYIYNYRTLLNNQRTLSTHYIKEQPDGFIRITDDNGRLENYFIPFPIFVGAELNGPFDIFFNESIAMVTKKKRPTFKTKNGIVYSNVVEAQSKNEKVKIFFTEEEFIIEVHDLRYTNIKASLNPNVVTSCELLDSNETRLIGRRT